MAATSLPPVFALSQCHPIRDMRSLPQVAARTSYLLWRPVLLVSTLLRATREQQFWGPPPPTKSLLAPSLRLSTLILRARERRRVGFYLWVALFWLGSHTLRLLHWAFVTNSTCASRSATSRPLPRLLNSEMYSRQLATSRAYGYGFRRHMALLFWRSTTPGMLYARGAKFRVRFYAGWRMPVWRQCSLPPKIWRRCVVECSLLS